MLAEVISYLYGIFFTIKISSRIYTFFWEKRRSLFQYPIASEIYDKNPIHKFYYKTTWGKYHGIWHNLEKPFQNKGAPLSIFLFVIHGIITYIFIVNEILFRLTSTSITFTLTTWPTFTASRGCFINLSQICEICTSPSS